MTKSSNVEVIVDRMIDYMISINDNHYKTDIASRCVELAEQFAPSNQWFIQTMNKVFEHAGDLENVKVAHNLMQLVAEGFGEDDDPADSQLRSSAVESYLRIIGEPKLPSVFLQVICWVLGEYGTADGKYSASCITGKLCDVAEAYPNDETVKAPVSPTLSLGAQPQVGASSVYGVTQLSSSVPALAGPYSGPSGRGILMDQAFLERPGEPECQYYLKTGGCKFGLSCRYHHPRDRILPRTNCLLSPIGLPLRLGVQACSFYLQNGHCKFGTTCKFDHPLGTTIRYSPSASSLIDVLVAPYPMLSSSSSELISGLKNDSYPSSGSTVSLIFSQIGPLPLSDLQLPGQTSVSLSSSRSKRQVADVCRST